MSGTSTGFDAESRPTTDLRTEGRTLPKRRRVIKHQAETVGATPRADRSAFHEFAEALRTEISPGDILESILAERVILSAWRLKGASRTEEICSTIDGPKRGTSAASVLDPESLTETRREARLAERSLRRSLGDLDRYRDNRSPQWGKAWRSDPRDVPRPSFDHDPDARPALPSVSNEWPVLPDHPDRPNHANAGDAARDLPCWTDRLVFDHNVSESSPVVRGTWVTVNHMVSLVVDGWTWADILRSHPELGEDDIRACLAYATEEETIAA